MEMCSTSHCENILDIRVNWGARALGHENTCFEDPDIPDDFDENNFCFHHTMLVLNFVASGADKCDVSFIF